MKLNMRKRESLVFRERRIDPSLRVVTAVLGSVTRNSRAAWLNASELLNSSCKLPVVLTKQANVSSPEIIQIEGKGNIFDRVRGRYTIMCCYILPHYGDTTMEEIETAKSLNVFVRYLK